MDAYQEFRREKDAFMKRHAQSPLSVAQKAAFTGLTYYPVDAALRFVVAPEEFAEKDVVTMQTNTGELRRYKRWGRVHFVVDGETASLTLFETENGFFVPFTDATSGAETYGAGRYLEPIEASDGRIVVDFNQAYNPYCVYSYQYSCPIPPAENRLEVAIRAGEKLPEGEWAGMME